MKRRTLNVLLCLAWCCFSAQNKHEEEKKNLFGQPASVPECTVVTMQRGDEQYRFFYNEKKQLEKVEQPTGPLFVTYNEANRITGLKNVDGWNLTLHYSTEGLLEKTNCTNQNGLSLTLEFSYAHLNRTINVLCRDPSGKERYRLRYTFDNLYNLSNITVTSSADDASVNGSALNVNHHLVKNFSLSLGDARFMSMLVPGDYIGEGISEMASTHVPNNTTFSNPNDPEARYFYNISVIETNDEGFPTRVQLENEGAQSLITFSYSKQAS